MGKRGQDDLLTVTDAARLLGVTDRQVRNLIGVYNVPTLMIGGSHVIKRGDLSKIPKVRKAGRKPKGDK